MQATANLEIGQMAPDFKLKGPGGQAVTLSEYRGKKHVVLAFFPLAFSPTCSHQLPTIQKEMSAFEELDAVVFGVSIDSHHANTAFAKQLGLSFTLLSDFGREASTAYGVLLPEKGFSGRALFLIDKQGKLAYKDISPDTAQIPSNASLLETLRALR